MCSVQEAAERDITIRAAGIDFHARQQGDRPRAVFLHGFGADLGTWHCFWSELRAALPPLRYDLRGFGQSRCDDSAAFNHADDLLAILDATGLARCCGAVLPLAGAGVPV